MADLESAVPAQSVVKDVQILKANLKEQEKRARAGSETQDVIPDAIPQPTVNEEQRKRRKVSNPVEPNQDPEIVVLDGPLPPAKESTKPALDPSTPSKALEEPVAQQKHAGLATCNPSSPTKIADKTESSHGPKPVVDAPAVAQLEVNKGQQEVASGSDGSPKKSVASNNESMADDRKLTEEVKEAPTATSESKEQATTAEPAVKTDQSILS